jgi:hypothetical protein
MVQNETMKVLSLSYVDFRTGPKAQGPTRPQPADGLWAENNTDMPILGILHKKADFPGINYLWKRTLIVSNWLAFGMKLNPLSLQMRSSADERVILEQENTPTSVYKKYIFMC